MSEGDKIPYAEQTRNLKAMVIDVQEEKNDKIGNDCNMESIKKQLRSNQQAIAHKIKIN